MSRYKPVGWRNESQRHSLASKGIKTGSKVSSYKVISAEGLKLGDVVMLKDDVLIRHSRSVPVHAGYTTEQFSWRDTLGKLKGKKGIVQRVFDSGNINVDFDGELIGINKSEVVLGIKTGSKSRSYKVVGAKGKKIKMTEKYDFSNDEIKKIYEFLITEGNVMNNKRKRGLLVYYILSNPKLAKSMANDMLESSYIYSGTKDIVRENLKCF